MQLPTETHRDPWEWGCCVGTCCPALHYCSEKTGSAALIPSQKAKTEGPDHLLLLLSSDREKPPPFILFTTSISFLLSMNARSAYHAVHVLFTCWLRGITRGRGVNQVIRSGMGEMKPSSVTWSRPTAHMSFVSFCPRNHVRPSRPLPARRFSSFSGAGPCCRCAYTFMATPSSPCNPTCIAVMKYLVLPLLSVASSLEDGLFHLWTLSTQHNWPKCLNLELTEWKKKIPYHQEPVKLSCM